MTSVAKIDKPKQHNIDMTVGNPLKAIVLFTLPLLLGNVFQQLYNIVDSIVVGKFIGDEAMGAVASSGSLINLLIGLIQGISVGGGIVIAQYFGANEKDKMRKTIHTLVAFGLALGAAMTIIGFFLSQLMLQWMDTPAKILPQSTNYFKTYFLGIIFTIMYNCGSSIFRAVGDSRHPLYYLIVASVVNVLLDLLFVGLFKWGIYGVAIATIASQAVSCMLTFYKLIYDKTDYQLNIKEIRFNKDEFIKILAYGIPTGIQNSIISFSNVFIQKNINSFGEIATEGCGAYSKIEGFATMPSGSFSMALSTFVGQNIGAKKYERAKKGAYQGLICSMLSCEFLGLLLFIFCPYLLRLFSDTPEVIAQGVQETRTITLFYFMLAFAHGMSGILRGAGYNKIPMFTMIICWVFVRLVGISIALQIPELNHIQTIFWFYPITWSLSLIVLIIISFITKWSKPRYV